jgi:hypothetical protein
MATVSPVAAAVLKGSQGVIVGGTIKAAITITQGQVVWIDDTGFVTLANAASTIPTQVAAGTMGQIGMALTAGGPLQPIDFDTSDGAFTHGAAAQTSGIPLFLDNVAGAIVDSLSDLASTNTIICLGGTLTGGLTMKLNPQVWGVKA